MTNPYSKSRQQAEAAFGSLQTAFFAKNNATEAGKVSVAMAHVFETL